MQLTNQGLNRDLATKEIMMNKITATDSRFLLIKSDFQKQQRELEDEITNLQKEKDALLNRLVGVVVVARHGVAICEKCS